MAHYLQLAYYMPQTTYLSLAGQLEPCRQGRRDLVRLLLDNGAKVDGADEWVGGLGLSAFSQLSAPA